MHILLYERLPVCKASILLTFASSCSSLSGLIAVGSTGHYEIRWPETYSPHGLYFQGYIQAYQVTVFIITLATIATFQHSLFLRVNTAFASPMVAAAVVAIRSPTQGISISRIQVSLCVATLICFFQDHLSTGPAHSVRCSVLWTRWWDTVAVSFSVAPVQPVTPCP